MAFVITAATNALIGIGFSKTVAAGVLKFAGSFLLSTAANALLARGRKGTVTDVARELAVPSTAPQYRFVYGETKAVGTPAGIPVRASGANRVVYGCWVFNSRESDLPTVELLLDKREVSFTGDPFDLTGAGAVASDALFVEGATNLFRFWIGRGDQTAAPDDFVAAAPWAENTDEDLWLATDAWRGRTVLWAQITNGNANQRQERWPNAPPQIELIGRWSKVWDCRDTAQALDDPTTWAWSDNHRLCLLDALTQNPLRAYLETNLHLPSWRDAATVADELVEKADGSTEARYRAGGTLLWNGETELEQQIIPLAASGAADLIQIGGQRGVTGGIWMPPETTMQYTLGDALDITFMAEGRNLPNQMSVSYLSPTRGYEEAFLLQWDIPGALAEDQGTPVLKTLDLPFCPSATQAMRIRKIVGLRLRRQKRISGGEMPPEMLDLLPGATVNVEFPDPYQSLNTTYEIDGMFPSFDMLGETGVALRIPAVLIEHTASIYAYDPVVDEEEVRDEPYLSGRQNTAIPGEITVTTGDTVNFDTGGGIIPRIRFAFDPSASAGVRDYEWEYRPAGDIYRAGGFIPFDVLGGDGKVFDFFSGTAGVSYDLRVRARGDAGISDWREFSNATPVVNISITAPTAISATGGAGEIDVVMLTPNDVDHQSLEFWGGDVDDVEDATLLTTVVSAANATIEFTETGLGAAETRYYWGRSRGPFNSASAFSASVNATTDP